MINFAFWNINKKSLAAEVVELARYVRDSSKLGVQADTIVGFAEPTGTNWDNVVSILGAGWTLNRSARGNMVVISQLKSGSLYQSAARGGAYFLGLARPTKNDFHRFVICFAHLESPLGKFFPQSNSYSQALSLRNRIVEIESEWSVPDTILLGDLNMDPYNPAMINGQGLNAAMCKHVSKQKHRTFGSKEDKEIVRFFYNPMWRFLGDRTQANQPGTFYNSGDKTDSAVWHCIDQCLVRPSLIKSLALDSPKILTSFGDVNLLTKRGVINKSISDHLPIFASLAI